MQKLRLWGAGNTLICTWQRENWRGKHLTENIHQHGGKSGSFSKSSASRSSVTGTLFALMKDSGWAYDTSWTETPTEARLPRRAAPGNSFPWYYHHLYEMKALALPAMMMSVALGLLGRRETLTLSCHQVSFYCLCFSYIWPLLP